ncbi:hypothetical protein [Prescottella agglutinans]|uniref:Uncharacterized protein n=1 Tax=Prescottella agglutinans TaxID=1644129 RepID=A0ABT6ML65_9NOCA|nr:hypothetical protein [Prescottella agglutinans]MDH6284630.1 hypothetical protein [Prescottella agglutinans]
MTDPAKLRIMRITVRVALGALSCALFGFSLYTLFSDSPADWTPFWLLVLPMAACALLLDALDRRIRSRRRR